MTQSPAPGSLVRNSLASLAASAATLVFGLFTSVITARALGPASKGTLSTLLWLGNVLFLYACSMGLGDAAVVAIGKGRATLDKAVSVSVIPLLLGSALGAITLWVLSFPANWTGIRIAVVITGLTLIFRVLTDLLSAVLSSLERFVTMSMIVSISLAASALTTWIFVMPLSLGIAGGVLGSFIGGAVALLMFLLALRKEQISIRPHIDFRYLRSAVRYGVGIQTAFLLIAMSERFDQLIVYSLVGEAAAGQYTIALTMGQFVGYLPLAASKGSFPRIASLPEKEAVTLIFQVVRFGLATALLGAIALSIALPFLIPLLFGEVYARAMTPALILLLGGVMWSVQWILARGAAARGNSSLLIYCFGGTVIVMIGLDLLFIPNWGIVGAAVASAMASTVGAAICLGIYGRHLPGHLSLSYVIPTADDYRKLWGLTRRLLPPRRGTG